MKKSLGNEKNEKGLDGWEPNIPHPFNSRTYWKTRIVQREILLKMRQQRQRRVRTFLNPLNDPIESTEN